MLDVRDVTVRFGGINALDDVSLAGRRRARRSVWSVPTEPARRRCSTACSASCARIGAASRSTGATSAACPTYKRARLGIGRTFQRVELFAGMTVREHLLVAERSRRGDGGLLKDMLNQGAPERRRDRDRGRDARAARHRRRSRIRPVEALTLGQSRLVELGRALMGDPRLLLLDEPSSGLDVARDAGAGDGCSRTCERERGTAILLVEHDLDLVAPRCRPAVRARLRPHRSRPARARRSCARRPSSPRTSVSRRRERRPAPRHGGARAATTSTPATDRSARCSACRSRCRGAACARCSDRTARARRPWRGSRRVSSRRRPGTVWVAGRRRDRTAGVEARPARRRARGRGALGVRVAVRGGQPAPLVPPVGRRRRRQRRLAAGVRRASLGSASGDGRRPERCPAASSACSRSARVLADPPSVLIADELSLGLAPVIVDEVYATLATIRDAGTSLLIVEQQVAARHRAGRRRRRARQGRGALRRPRGRDRRPRRRAAADHLSG